MNGSQILTKSGLFAIDVDASRNLGLASPNAEKQSQRWSTVDNVSGDRRRAYMKAVLLHSKASPKPRILATDTTIRYRITVVTDNMWFAGIDDKVEIALQGSLRTSQLVGLKNSLTHSDPFERGQTDVFEVDLFEVGEIRGIHLRY